MGNVKPSKSPAGPRTGGKLLSVIPVAGNVQAVYYDDEGKPFFGTVVCLALIEYGESLRTVEGFRPGAHISSCESAENFVSYAPANADLDDYTDRAWDVFLENKRRAKAG